MNLQKLRVYSFECTSLLALQTVVNDFCALKAVTVLMTGTAAWPANEAKNKTLVDQQYLLDGTHYTMVLFYSEV